MAQFYSAVDSRAVLPEDLAEALSAPSIGEAQVFLLAPSAERDLVGLARTLEAADAAIVIAQPGQVTRADIERLANASRGRPRNLVLVTV